jgi:hypothetical protein
MSKLKKYYVGTTDDFRSHLGKAYFHDETGICKQENSWISGSYYMEFFKLSEGGTVNAFLLRAVPDRKKSDPGFKIDKYEYIQNDQRGYWQGAIKETPFHHPTGTTETIWINLFSNELINTFDSDNDNRKAEAIESINRYLRHDDNSDIIRIKQEYIVGGQINDSTKRNF